MASTVKANQWRQSPSAPWNSPLIPFIRRPLPGAHRHCRRRRGGRARGGERRRVAPSSLCPGTSEVSMACSIALSLSLVGFLAPRPLPVDGWKGPRPAYRLRLTVPRPGAAPAAAAPIHGVEAYHETALGQVVY